LEEGRVVVSNGRSCLEAIHVLIINVLFGLLFIIIIIFEPLSRSTFIWNDQSLMSSTPLMVGNTTNNAIMEMELQTLGESPLSGEVLV
jgi:hypothetical protein